MKILKLLIFTAVFFIGFRVNASENFPNYIDDKLLLLQLYEAYDLIKSAYPTPTFWDILTSRVAKYPDDRWKAYLPKDVSIDRCKQVLHAEQERLRQELDSLSYKDAIFSFTF